MAGIIVGGPQAHKVQRHGELAVAYHWVGSGGNDPEPTMCIYPAVPSRGAGVVMIGISAAYKYADPRSGEPTDYLLHQTIPFAKHMGMVMTSSTLRKIADVIVDGLPDLIAMPPEPYDFEAERRKAEGKVGEMRVIANGEVVAEAEV